MVRSPNRSDVTLLVMVMPRSFSWSNESMARSVDTSSPVNFSSASTNDVLPWSTAGRRIHASAASSTVPNALNTSPVRTHAHNLSPCATTATFLRSSRTVDSARNGTGTRTAAPNSRRATSIADKGVWGTFLPTRSSTFYQDLG